MKRLMVLILMVVLSAPVFVFADHAGGSKGKGKSKVHSNNGKHKGWYKDGHKRASNDRVGGSKRHSKKKTNAPYASGSYKKPTSTVSNSGEMKNTGGATVKPTPTTSEGGVSKGSSTMSHTGGSVKATAATTSEGGVSKK